MPDQILSGFLQKLALSLMIGILVGIEREHRRKVEEIFAGVRTFALACITGMFAAYIAGLLGSGILLITTFFFALICVILTYLKNIVYRQPGLTSPIALFCTFLLGILVAEDYYLFAIMGAVVLTFLLIEEKPLHTFAEHLSDEEILNSVQFLIVVFILYPIVPDEPVFGVMNLKSAILIVVIVAFISFVSYLLLRKFGGRSGISYSGLLGGFVNSEATTSALSSMSKKRPVLVNAAYIGILLSNTSMLIRNLIIAMVVDPSGRIALLMLPPQLMIIIVSSLIVLTRGKAFGAMNETLEIKSPFSLGPAFKFGAGFTVLLVIAKTANDILGSTAVYATALGGIVSSAAVTVSMAALAVDGSVSFTTAAETAVMASIISTLNKVILIKISGSKELFSLSRNTFALLALIGAIAIVGWAYYLHSGLF
jgi:uncharacterized membrane protein (DUF4010 family)